MRATAPTRATAPMRARGHPCTKGHPHARRRHLCAKCHLWPSKSTSGSGHEATSVKTHPQLIAGLALEWSQPMHREGFGEQRWAPSKGLSVGTGEPRRRHGQRQGGGHLWSLGGAWDGCAGGLSPATEGYLEKCWGGLHRDATKGMGSMGQSSSTAKPPQLGHPSWPPEPPPVLLLPPPWPHRLKTKTLRLF